jgi:hypothetical protein
MIPTCMHSSGLGLELVLNRCNGSYHMVTGTVATGPVLQPKTRYFNHTTLVPIENLSFDCIVTWLIRRLWSFSRSSTSLFQISDLTIICGAAHKNPRISLKCNLHIAATQQISVGSQLWILDVTDLIQPQNLRIRYVTIQSAHKNKIAVKAVGTATLELRSGSNTAKTEHLYNRYG